uniref:Uncharacterized protein n=1 Tax=Anguilla anguilla TaxID=7936 RepID=A0A0E9STA2_ANGAN
MNSWILLFLYKCRICLITPVPLRLPIGFYPWMYHFLGFPFFSPTKRKNHFVNKPLRNGRLKTSTSPTF